MRRLSIDEVRRVAIASQGLAAPRPAGTPNLGHLRRAIRKMGVLQIDSVNVVERAHHLTMFSRLGPHDSGLLWRALEERLVFEYWARMASFSPIEDFPLFRYRMAHYAEGNWRWVRELIAKAPGYVEAVYDQVVERGPLTPADLDEPGNRSGPWWGWGQGKVALEYLFAAGRVTVSHRRNFSRYYDVTERVIPSEYLKLDPVPAEEAIKRLLLQAAAALGVGTARDIVDYYSIRGAEGLVGLKSLVADGSLVEVEVEGWPATYMHARSKIPRAIRARSLINPFDPLMWNRDRIERIHGFRYRIEIYVPAPKRVHGYYVFPFLLGEDLVARVDLKADRAAKVLRVHGAFLEPGADPVYVSRELVAELGEMARWLRLEDIAIGSKGDLARHLRNSI